MFLGVYDKEHASGPLSLFKCLFECKLNKKFPESLPISLMP